MPDLRQSEFAVRWAPPPELLELAADDEELMDELIEAFQVDTIGRIERMRIALQDVDAARLRNEAHTVKGSARQVGADRLAETCQELELLVPHWQPASLTKQLDRLEEQFYETCQAMILYTASDPG